MELRLKGFPEYQLPSPSGLGIKKRPGMGRH